MQDDLETGKWYNLYRPKRVKPCLVYYYFSMDHRCLGFSFNYVDGAAFLPARDVLEDTRIVPVTITEE